MVVLTLGHRWRSMQIFIKMLDGKTEVLNVESHTLIDDVKAMVQRRSGMPTISQRLIFDGRQLEDGSTIFSYGVRRHNTLQLCGRLGVDPPERRINVQFRRGGTGLTVTAAIQPPVPEDYRRGLSIDGLTAYAARALGCDYDDIEELVDSQQQTITAEMLTDGSLVTVKVKAGAGGVMQTRSREERDAEGFASAIDLDEEAQAPTPASAATASVAKRRAASHAVPGLRARSSALTGPSPPPSPRAGASPSRRRRGAKSPLRPPPRASPARSSTTSPRTASRRCAQLTARRHRRRRWRSRPPPRPMPCPPPRLHSLRAASSASEQSRPPEERPEE